MVEITSVSILALTVGLSLRRPTIAGLHISPGTAAVLGALGTVVLGVVPFDLLVNTLRALFFPLLTIASLMVMTLVAERAGLLEILAQRITSAARGDARRLFALVFWCGALTGTIFTNDAAVLIFTPLVCRLVEDVAGDDWSPAARIPFYFAVLNVGNLAAPLVISNPINIIVASLFGIEFQEYAAWMIIPAGLSMVVTYLGLRLMFRRQLPATCQLRRRQSLYPIDRHLVLVCSLVLGATLVGLFSQAWTGIATWVVASAGAVILLLLFSRLGHSSWAVIRGVQWDVLVFVGGIFVVVIGLRNTGLLHHVGDLIVAIAGDDFHASLFTTGFVAAFSSALLCNHPTAGMMTWVIQDLSWPELETKLLVFAALVGGDLGPKMLPIGSLAALMWFQILARRGVRIPYWQYIAVGVPLALVAIVVALTALALELRLVQSWSG